MKRGQIFTLDLLAAVVVITVVLGFINLHFGDVTLHAQDLQFKKITLLADDFSQIAVKDALVDTPNVVDTSADDWNTKFSQLSSIISNTLPASYGAEISVGTLGLSVRGCIGKENVAVSKRAVFDLADNTVKTLQIKVCV